MPEGKIKKLTDKGFGFISTGTGQDMFFHSSNLEGVAFDDLQEGQRVSYNVGHGPKGPRAENVKLL
jgi:CspA family cold shock protein